MQTKIDNEMQHVNGEKVGLYRSLLKIVAQLNERKYTEDSSTQNGQQAVVRQHNDLSDPASDVSTSQD